MKNFITSFGLRGRYLTEIIPKLCLTNNITVHCRFMFPQCQYPVNRHACHTEEKTYAMLVGLMVETQDDQYKQSNTCCDGYQYMYLL